MRLRAIALALGLCAACGAPLASIFSPVSPHVVQRPEYGSCIELGGKVHLPTIGTVTQLSSTCFRAAVDGGVEPDEEGPTCDKVDGGCP